MIETFHIGLRGISKRFGKRVVLDSTVIDPRSYHCVVINGENGAAKTTLLGPIEGFEKPDHGDVVTDDAIARPWWRQRQRPLESISQSRRA